jgi:hypothetical protein
VSIILRKDGILMPVKVFKDNSGNATEVKDIKVCVDGVWRSVYGSSKVTLQFLTARGIAPTKQTVEFKTQVTLPTIQNVTGYKHTGWTCDGITYTPGQKITVYGNMIFTAVWELITFNIYLYKSGSLERTLTVPYGGSVDLGGTYLPDFRGTHPYNRLYIGTGDDISTYYDPYDGDVNLYIAVKSTISNVTCDWILHKCNIEYIGYVQITLRVHDEYTILDSTNCKYTDAESNKSYILYDGGDCVAYVVVVSNNGYIVLDGSNKLGLFAYGKRDEHTGSIDYNDDITLEFRIVRFVRVKTI